MAKGKTPKAEMPKMPKAPMPMPMPEGMPTGGKGKTGTTGPKKPGGKKK